MKLHGNVNDSLKNTGVFYYNVKYMKEMLADLI